MYLMQLKSDAYDMLCVFITFVRTQFKKQVKVVRSDNGLEFDDHRCTKLYAELGVIHQTTCVDRPQQNGRAERKHMNILEMSRALRLQAGLPLSFWGDCVLTATYITNRLPTPILNNVSPYEKLFKRKPNYNHLKTFGCLVMAFNPALNRDKFSEREVPCTFLGYP